MWKKLNRMKYIYRISIGLHVELRDRFFSLVLVHWSSLDPELCLIFRDIYEYAWRIHRLSNCLLSENFTEFFRKQETSCFRGKRNDSPPILTDALPHYQPPVIKPTAITPPSCRSSLIWTPGGSDKSRSNPRSQSQPSCGDKDHSVGPPCQDPTCAKAWNTCMEKNHDKLLLRYHLIANKSWPEQDKGTPHPPAPER